MEETRGSTFYLGTKDLYSYLNILLNICVLDTILNIENAAMTTKKNSLDHGA